MRSLGRGDPTYAQDTGVQVASLFMFPGLLARAANSAFADSNGEFLYYYHSDHLGTPLFLTDVSGTVVWQGEYLPFGDVFTEDKDPDGDGVDVEQPFRFPGQYHDHETGLYYNYFRDYNPVLGRYIEADPIGLAGGVNLWGYGDIVGKSSIQANLYLYTSADPINRIDPLGLFDFLEFVAKAEMSLEPYAVAGGFIVTGTAHIIAGTLVPPTAIMNYPIGIALIYTGLDIYLDELPFLGINLIPGFDPFKHEEKIEEKNQQKEEKTNCK